MDQNPPTFLTAQQIQVHPSSNGGLSDIERGYPMSRNAQMGVPTFAGNPYQVPQHAPETGPYQTACLVIGTVGIIFELMNAILVYTESGVRVYAPPLLFLAFRIVIGDNLNVRDNLSVETFKNKALATFYFLSVPMLIINGLLIAGSKMKSSVCVIMYMIVTGIYVLIFLIVFITTSGPGSFFVIRAEIYHYLYMLLLIGLLVVAGLYYKELETGQTQRRGQGYMQQNQGQVYMQQGQGQVYMQQGQGPFYMQQGQEVVETLGQNQISRSTSQAYGPSGQVVGSPGEGQQYGQSY